MLAAAILTTAAFAQSGNIAISPEQMKAMRKMRAGGPPPEAQPAQPAQPQQPEAKPDDKKKEGDDANKKKESENNTVKRPDKPPRVPDPREFKVKLDDKGRVPPFNFIGQPWPDVMQWLASLSKCTLDWQEMPSDYLNLTTDRPLPLDEVQDRINRALQARGFTSIRANDVLSIFKIDKIEPSLVHQVEEERLYNLKPYDFVKVSFDLPQGMEVDKAKDDVKQLLSPTAKIVPLVSSHRLLIMDTVANLRTVSEMLNNERMVQDGRIVPKEYFLKYTRPQQVIEILYMMVGVDPKAKPAQTDPQMQAQQMQMMQQMQQQGRGAEAAKMMQKDVPKVYLAYNRQRNSVLVNAPPELLKIIEQTIKYLDVPYGDAASTPSAAGAASGGAPTMGPRTMRHYPLNSLDPDKFVSTLEEIGGLSPDAVFKVDDNSKTLFALASEADQAKIEKLLHDFDGSGRRFHVIQLHRKPADLVAATVFKLMGGQNDKKDDNNRRRYWYYDFDGSNNDKKKDTVQGFGVDADIESNQLLLWATDVEMERVRELLVEMGEIPDGKDLRPVRFVVPPDGTPTAEWLKQLKQAWTAENGNDLIINVVPGQKPAPKPPASDDDAEKTDKKDKPTGEKSKQPDKDRSADLDRSGRIAARFAELSPNSFDSLKPQTQATSSNNDTAAKTAQSPSPSTASAPSPATTPSTTAPPVRTPAPITITVTPDGRIMLSSTDTVALDRLQQMIEQLTPQKRFKVYKLAHIRAFDFYLDLLDVFKDDLEGKDKNNDYADWWWGYPSKSKDDKSATGLSKRRKLMITYDPPTNAILVANASPSQLAEIEQLIHEFDIPAPKDSVELRVTEPIKIKYSRPTVIAAAVKEVYRDLLSSKDKEFDRSDQKDKKGGRTERVTIIDYPGSSDENEGRQSPVKVGFDGALSLGADDVSGVLIVSAQKALFPDIKRMVEELDAQAAPKTTVQVRRVTGAVSAEALQKALDKAVGKAWLGNRPEQQMLQTGPDAEKKTTGKENRKSKDSGQESEKRD